MLAAYCLIVWFGRRGQTHCLIKTLIRSRVMAPEFTTSCISLGAVSRKAELNLSVHLVVFSLCRSLEDRMGAETDKVISPGGGSKSWYSCQPGLLVTSSRHRYHPAADKSMEWQTATVLNFSKGRHLGSDKRCRPQAVRFRFCGYLVNI